MKLKQCTDFIDEIDNDFISLYSLWEKCIFNDINFCEIESLIPLWLAEAGRSSESDINKETFEKFLKCNSNELTHRILYFYDVQNILSALQDRIQSVKHLISELYKIVPFQSNIIKCTEIDNVIMQMDNKATIAHLLINSVCVNLASALDLFTKFVYEIENIKHCSFEDYKKIKSCKNGILFMGYSPQHEELKCKNMIFCKPVCRTLKLISTLRNEYVHNGAWDYREIIYNSISNGIIVDSFILLPDIDEYGNFVTTRSRNKFYSKEEKSILHYLIIFWKL